MTTGFSFGAKTTAAPTFGGSGSITFGTPATQQPAQQFNFGSSGTPSLFGTPAATTTSFGAPTSTTNTGFSFGAPAPASTGFSFGAATSATGFSLGAPAPSASFGTPASGAPPASSAPSTGLSFGTAISSAPSTGFSFGPPASSAPSTGLSFGAPVSSAPGLSFGAPASTNFSFGGTSTAASTSLGFKPTTTTPSFGAQPSTGFSLLTSTATTSTPTTTVQNVGLGGVAFTQTKSGGSSVTQKELPPKEQLLPNEFSQLVEQFKNVVQEEKNRSSDVARVSVKEFHKVENELDALNNQFSILENQLLNNRNLAEQLKYETAKGLQNIEMAQRTQETPPNLQYDNMAPLQYFLDLADNFEREMQQLKLKIDNTEKFIKKCNEPNILTSQDLALGLKRLHETFVALAGRMQSVHSQVEAQKEYFLNVRKQVIKDNINPFDKLDKSSDLMSHVMKNAAKPIPPSLASGPTPFNSITLSSNNITLAAQQTQTPSFPPTATTTGLSFGLGNTSSMNSSLFKPTTGFGTTPFQLNTSSNFQLQKPPTGTKRGKQ